MLKAEVTDKYTKLEIVGDLKHICIDLAHILSAVNERLSERDEKLGHEFRMIFTKAFMDGVCFDDDREHMNHYLAEADKRETESKSTAEKTSDDFVDFLCGFIDFLKDKRDELEKANELLKKKMAKENDDEAE